MIGIIYAYYWYFKKGKSKIEDVNNHETVKQNIINEIEMEAGHEQQNKEDSESDGMYDIDNQQTKGQQREIEEKDEEVEQMYHNKETDDGNQINGENYGSVIDTPTVTY